MALETVESLADQVATDDSTAKVPESSPLRITMPETGLPPAGQRAESEGAPTFGLDLTLDDGLERMAAALAHVVRTGANLGLLMRGLEHVSASARAARAANTELMHELDELRSHLTRGQEEEQALRFRMSQLEQLLTVIRHETANERAFLIEQQDLFLIEIMTDHERQLAELKNRVGKSGPNPAAGQNLEELIVQRDQAREYATRCERERDLAWHELSTGASTSTAKGSVEGVQRSPSGAAAIGSISLRSVAVPASSPGSDTARPFEAPATGYSLSRDDISE